VPVRIATGVTSHANRSQAVSLHRVCEIRRTPDDAWELSSIQPSTSSPTQEVNQ
jgi:hypothetical protein